GRRGGVPAGRDVPRRPGDRAARRGLHGPDGGSDAGPPNLIPMSAGDLGAAALRAALFLSIWGTGAAIYAAWRRDVRALLSARIAAGVAFGLVVIAALSMMFALATHDFSILYVAENNARETPTFYSIISLWAVLEGSILLWTAILVGAARRRHRGRRLVEPRGARLGRRLGVGPGRECRYHALAPLDRVPALGHGRGEAEPAAHLEPCPRRRDVRADEPGDVPHTERRRKQRALVQPFRDRPDPPRLSRGDPGPVGRPSPVAVREAPRRRTDRRATVTRSDLSVSERALHGRDAHGSIGDAVPPRRGGDL